MSVHVISWVLQQSPTQHSDRLVLIVLADHAQADGTGAFPSYDTILREARLGSRSTVARSLERLEADGHIRPTGRHPKGMTVYQVMMGNADAFFRRPGGASETLVGSPESGSPKNGLQSTPAPTEEWTDVDESGHEPSLGTVQTTEPSSPEKDGSTDGLSPVSQADREKWTLIRARLEKRVAEIHFHNFIEPLELVRLGEHRLVVAAPPHALTSVRERYLPKLTAAARGVLGEGTEVDVVQTPVEEVV